MSNRTVIIILTVAAALLAYIFFFERGSMTTSERLGRKGRAFVEFRKDAVDEIEIQVAGASKIKLNRDPAKKALDEEKWQITAPKRLEADESTVREVLSAIDFLLVDRAVAGKSADPRFGLTKPRIEGAFTIRKKTTRFKIGTAAEGDKVYLSSNAMPDMVYAVSKEFFDSMNKRVDDLRSKKLVSGDLAEAVTLSVKRPLGTVTLKRDGKGGQWQVQAGGTWMLAAADQVQAITAAVEDLKADEFIKDNASESDLMPYGLLEPATSVSLDMPKGEKVTIRVGGDCPGRKNRRYVTAGDAKTVACVGDDFSSVLERPFIRFQEMRPAAFNAAEVIKVALSAGKARLAMIREGGEGGVWKPETGATALDDAAVEDLLKALSETRAEQVEVGEAVIAGLGAPNGNVTLTFMDAPKETVVEWFSGKEGGKDRAAKIRRAGEAALLTVPQSLIDKLRPDILAFRSKEVKQGDADQVKRIEIKGAAAQTLEKRDEVWQVTAPFAAAADNTETRALAELMTDIKVDRFVAEKAETAHGFANPFAVVTAKLDRASKPDGGIPASDSDEVILEIGAAVDGKRYARLKGKDNTVFIVDEAYEKAIAKPLIARDLLQIDDTTTARLSFEAGGRSLSLKKENDTWRAENDAVVDAEALKHAVENLAALKAINTEAFGPAGAGFDAPLLRVSAWADKQDGAEPTSRLTIGQKSPDENADGYFARKAGIEATFVVPTRLIDEIVKLVAPPQIN